MADPLSTTSAVVGLIDVCFRVGVYLKEVKDAAGRIEGDIDALQKEVKSLIDVNESIEKLKSLTEEIDPSSPINHSPQAEDLWLQVTSTTKGCKDVVLRLEEKVKDIMGKSQTAKPTGKIDGIKKTLKKQSTDPDLAKIHNSLSKYQLSLQTLLTALNVYYTRSSHKATDSAIGHLSKQSDKLHKQESKLHYQLEILRSRISSVDDDDDDDLRESIAAAAAVASKPINKHFMPPKSVSSIFTGREALLEELREALDDDSLLEGNSSQKRFVVQGLGGSGKTEFCCKFAQVNRQKFWAVFSINATSREAAKEGFAAISKVGGVEPNERAAKSWLSSLEVPWLLIIDNADDPSVDIEAFFPEGELGFILITTRVPDNIKHGTVGPKSYQFEMLENGAATDLLLKAARLKSPWDTTTVELANLITSALGCLPLALVHAGAAIANKLCELGSYLTYFKTFWETIRQARKDSGQAETEDDKTYMSVYSSYEVIYRKLDEGKLEKNRDAVELLKTFAFFNRDNIRLDALVAAAKNPALEAAAEEKEEEEKKSRFVGKPKSWTQLFRELLFALRTEILKDRSQPILPGMLRDVLRGSLPVAKFEFRLRRALHVLMQWSLITYHEENRSYSMHPLVHVWVRERPQMTLGEQAIWSQAAMNTLGQSISLPLSGEATKDEMELQRSLLLHVIHLRARKEEIREKIQGNQHAHTRFWPVVVPRSDLIITDRHRAKQAAKLSYIYFICGCWDEAEQLQEAVRDFLVPNLSLEHDASIRICRFLATTYWLKGRFNDAGDLSEQVLQAAVSSLGEEHHTTLKIKDNLGTIRNHQGRFPEAEDLFEQAIEGMKKTLGSNHQDTLCAIDNLGQVYWGCFEFEKAKEQHLKAIEGMKSHPNMGLTHEKTLIAKENLALAYREIGGEYLQTAHHLMEEVLNQRSEILGREQPYTLIAMSNLAYIKHAMGDHIEAESLIRKGIPIAERNLGEDHPGVLAAQFRLAEILAAQKRYEEADYIFRRLLDPNKYVGGLRKEGPVEGDYKDRIYTLYRYVLFWEQQGRTKEALATCEELCEVLEKSVHPIAQVAKDKRKDLRFLCGQTPNSV